MQTSAQLSLAIRLPPPDPSVWLKQQAIFCARLRCSIPRRDCARRQEPKSGRISERGYGPCQSGECLQGLKVLVELGKARKAVCECCGGAGWVPQRVS